MLLISGAQPPGNPSPSGQPGPTNGIRPSLPAGTVPRPAGAAPRPSGPGGLPARPGLAPQAAPSGVTSRPVCLAVGPGIPPWCIKQNSGTTYPCVLQTDPFGECDVQRTLPWVSQTMLELLHCLLSSSNVLALHTWTMKQYITTQDHERIRGSACKLLHSAQCAAPFRCKLPGVWAQGLRDGPRGSFFNGPLCGFADAASSAGRWPCPAPPCAADGRGKRASGGCRTGRACTRGAQTACPGATGPADHNQPSRGPSAAAANGPSTGAGWSRGEAGHASAHGTGPVIPARGSATGGRSTVGVGAARPGSRASARRRIWPPTWRTPGRAQRASTPASGSTANG